MRKTVTRRPIVNVVSEDPSGKFCGSCQRKLSLASYAKNKQNMDGLQAACFDCARAATNNYNFEVRRAALNAYGSKCVCCGEAEFKFLAIDHIDGIGVKQRKAQGGAIGHWLKKHKYPAGFQVLCHNCNMAKGFYGGCPHNDNDVAKEGSK